MPLMEAMACGLPSIATDWGAHTEFVHEGIAYPLRIRTTIPAVAKCPYYEGFRWADPDPEHLRVGHIAHPSQVCNLVERLAS